ncbi:type II toxin-antitoxin system HipA family toxin [Variovorax ginsengisoli]|uniref:Type II toxin-antitoxin system HipA family toxin n=1 Tax=Variovorax ginsengisoli TaxID=363844 RepID=A0ABT8S9Y0_9BURK|nr:type II toxin-antitoxin system HipA family toxin [Variovorax ginsengisoli]MDN8616425.1 type II toxin-antitoxin system HipA family toxin [Variovorax ginsengisoli]MDO1535595.1 type II toxin-antitoxin system HipA family toxin [Variovorax ginsengisoli]
MVGKFVYAKSYLALEHKLAIDPITLPLSPREYTTTQQLGFFGVFADSSPDSWGRGVIELMYGKPDSPVGYLLRSQDDRVGNLGFSVSAEKPPVQRPLPSREILSSAVGVLAGIERGQKEEPALEHWVRPNTAMGGARPKLTIADDNYQWIAKFPSRLDDPEVSIARLEHATHALAKLCGIDTVHSEVHSVDGHDILLVRRFDRTALKNGGVTTWGRNAFVSARTVLYSSPVNDYSESGSYANVARDMIRWSTKPGSDKPELFRRMVFNCLVSNSDDHERNHGFVGDDLAVGYRLSSAYDMVPRVPTTRRRVQAMLVGKTAAPTRENILSNVEPYGLTPKAAAEIYDHIQTTVRQNWRKCFDQSGLDERAMDKLASCFPSTLKEALRSAPRSVVESDDSKVHDEYRRPGPRTPSQ